MESKTKTRNNNTQKSEYQQTKENLFGRWAKSYGEEKSWFFKLLDLLIMTILTFVTLFIVYWNKAKTKQQKMKFIGSILLVLAIIFHYKAEDVLLYYYGTCTKGVVTSETPRNGATFYYSFDVNSKTYWGRSRIPGYDTARINDTIDIVYLSIFPDICRDIEGHYGGNFRNMHVKLKSKEYY